MSSVKLDGIVITSHPAWYVSLKEFCLQLSDGCRQFTINSTCDFTTVVTSAIMFNIWNNFTTDPNAF